ncbi:MAG: tetratricopeptide repeat protein [Bacteroidia bacterium]|nr:tetratricopeptide repeat protein [Bacteroidia bacterium]
MKSKWLIILLAFAGLARGDEYQDSLQGRLAENLSDSVRMKVLYKLADHLSSDSVQKAMHYSRELELLASNTENKKYLGRAYFLQGTCFDHLQSFKEAMDYYYKALPLLEETADTAVLVRTYNQIGIISSYQKNYEVALKYFIKFSAIAKARKDDRLLGNVYNNIGVTYKNLGRMDLANEFAFRSLAIFEKLDFKRGIASSYLNLGVNHDKSGEHEEAQKYNFKALNLFREIQNDFGLITSYTNIADSYKNSGHLAMALTYFDSSQTLCLSTGSFIQLKDTYEGLAEVHRLQNNHKSAYEYYRKFITLRDSLFSDESARKSADLEARQELLKTEKELDLLKKNDEIRDLELNRNKIFVVLLILAVLSVGIIAYLLFQRNKSKQSANEVLQLQKEEILHQKNEITDSINYARRIQESILPPDRIVKAVLPDSFVLYLPKDIVSGDFYWADKKDGRSWFAAVDCTGHGVPGAMMSVLGFNLIQQSLHDKGLQTPGEILKNLDNGVNMTLRQSGSDDTVKDGMDLALCCIDWHKMELQYAGAYNPLWLLKKDSVDILEIKADKKIIGSNVNDVADEFTNHRLSLHRGDLVYLLSDGYADQFGGPNDKKFKYRPMKELLLRIRGKEMAEQHKILKQTIREWQGSCEQVDDILIIGVRV